METVQEKVRQVRAKGLADAKAEIAEARHQYHKQVAAYIVAYPEKTWAQIAEHFNMSRSFISQVAKEFNVQRDRVGRPSKEK